MQPHPSLFFGKWKALFSYTTVGGSKLPPYKKYQQLCKLQRKNKEGMLCRIPSFLFS